LINTATVSAAADSTPLNNSAKDDDTLTPQANLSITKDDGVTTVTAGNGVTYTYTIMVTNNGPSAAQGVTVSDTWTDAVTRGTITAPAGSTVTNGADGNDFTVSLGAPLAPGASATVTVQYTVAASVAAGAYTNSATVHSPTDPTDSTATDTDTVATSAD